MEEIKKKHNKEVTLLNKENIDDLFTTNVVFCYSNPSKKTLCDCGTCGREDPHIPKHMKDRICGICYCHFTNIDNKYFIRMTRNEELCMFQINIETVPKLSDITKKREDIQILEENSKYKSGDEIYICITIVKL